MSASICRVGRKHFWFPCTKMFKYSRSKSTTGILFGF